MPLVLANLNEGCCAFTHLRNRAWRTVHLVCSNRLDRVDNYQFWSHFLNMGEDFLQLRFAENRNMMKAFVASEALQRGSSRSPQYSARPFANLSARSLI